MKYGDNSLCDFGLSDSDTPSSSRSTLAAAACHASSSSLDDIALWGPVDTALPALVSPLMGVVDVAVVE